MRWRFLDLGRGTFVSYSSTIWVERCRKVKAFFRDSERLSQDGKVEFGSTRVDTVYFNLIS